MAGAALLVLYGVFSAATTLSLTSLRNTLAYHEDFHKGLAVALHSPAVERELKRCPLLTLPNNKLIPDARWILDTTNQHEIVARSQARADVHKGSHALESRIKRGSVAVFPLGSAVFYTAIVDVGDDPRDQIPQAATTASSRATTTRSMATAERVPVLLGAQLPRRWAWPALALILAGGLGLRLWGVQQGLPYAYNADEADHFVPRAVAIFGHDLNPHYFANPPGFTYVLHYLFALAYGGTSGVRHAFAYHPTEVYTLSRVAVAVLGVLALWLLYATGARLFGRAAGLLAAAIEAVAFLPVFYSHLALNDVPTLAPLTLSLLGSAGVLCKGRKRDYALAGIGLGLACATKYTAGIALVPLIAATAARLLAGRRADGEERDRDPRCRGSLLCAGSTGAWCSRWPSASPWRPSSPSRPSSQPTRSGCSTTSPSTPNWCTSPRSRPKPRASSARRSRAASSTTCGRSAGG